MSGRPLFDRRAYAREYARKQRARKLALRNVSATTCQAGLGAGVCGGILDTITDGQGRTRIVCPLCERKLRGICRDCGLPVAGKVGYALRCARHTAEARREYSEVYRTRHPDEYRRNSRRAYQKSAAVRRDRNEYKRLWRKANRDKVRAQKRRANLRGYGRQLQAERRERLRAAGLTLSPAPRKALRVCLTPGCEIVVTGRKKKCTRCKEREGQQARQLLEQRRGLAT